MKVAGGFRLDALKMIGENDRVKDKNPDSYWGITKIMESGLASC